MPTDTPAVYLRGIDPELWRRLKAEATLQSKSPSELLNAILRPTLADLEITRRGGHSAREEAYQAGYDAGRGRK